MSTLLSLPVLQGCRTIQLPKGMNTLVDDDLLEYRLLNSLTWGLVHQGGDFYYAIHQERRCGKLTTVKMHRFIMDAPNGVDVDHANRDTLDNRRANLRVATRSDNCCNGGKKNRRAGSSSRFKGVSRNGKNSWAARITKNNVTYALGNFATEEEAARAYDAAAREMHGEFAVTNELLDVAV